MGPNVIAFSSGKGGVGKTSLSVNVASLLAQAGTKTLLVDGDLGLANVDILLNLNVETTLQDVLEQKAELSDSLAWVNNNFAVLPATSGVPDMVNQGPDAQKQMGELLDQLGSEFDMILIDTAAGIGADVLWFNHLSQISTVVLTPDPTSITDAYALIKVIWQEYDRQEFHLLLNQVQDEEEAEKFYSGLTKVCENYLQFRPQFLGHVTKDSSVQKGLRSKKPFAQEFPQSQATQDLTQIVIRLKELSMNQA